MPGRVTTPLRWRAQQNIGQGPAAMAGITEQEPGAMPDENTTATTEQPPAAPPAGPADPTLPGLETDDGDEGDGSDADKRLATERRNYKAANKRANELAKSVEALQAKVKQFEDRDKTEQQRAAEELEAAKAEAQKARDERDHVVLDLLRRQVGDEKGLPGYLGELLRGNTREELEAHADRLIKERAAEENGAPPKVRKPQPDPRLGRASDGKISTADQFAAAIRNKF